MNIEGVPDASSVPVVQPSSDLVNGRWLVLDTRSPGEHAAGHIPGAHSVPLFDDAERSMIGTLYKQRGQAAAIEQGLQAVNPKLNFLVASVRELHARFPKQEIVVHCWRGGMRSGSVAWLLQESGLPVKRLSGGYKAYRKWVRMELAKDRPYVILGGMTGVGKTPILTAMKARGAAVLDLEELANHLGSAFGNLEELAQPSTEQFANDVQAQLNAFDTADRIWIEDESRHVGKVNLPEELYERMRRAPYVEIKRSEGERLDQLCAIYGQANVESLKAAFVRITKKLGGQHVVSAHKFLDQGDLRSAAAIGLRYYDKLYAHTRSRYPRTLSGTFEATGLDVDLTAAALVEWEFSSNTTK
jgi:tRNA 2-selenouridine synthase